VHAVITIGSAVQAHQSRRQKILVRDGDTDAVVELGTHRHEDAAQDEGGLRVYFHVQRGCGSCEAEKVVRW
jgi:hypothetical protein